MAEEGAPMPVSIDGTKHLKEIAIDYSPEAFGAKIKCPGGNTSGLNFNIYLSSLEGDKSQDQIDFEFLGKDKTIVQTNFYTNGTDN
ncbi:hypothetical protein EJ110_NYTH04269 [Nymphaea thermarum]|nr:hypothetical protein EJ110_NYTH04269 [Nymphaea thermarum]